jgi:TetR/AcrR family transcriptional regulator, cholesterol catabolism regulator
MLSDQKQRFKMPEPTPHPTQRIIDTVIELLESEGYEGVQLRDVARQARIGLGTIYKLFSSREDLIVSAIEYWMDTNTFSQLATPAPNETLYDGLMRVFKNVFEPWERNPWMLKAFYRARSGPGGERLQLQGADAIVPLTQAVLEEGDPHYTRDIGAVLASVAHGVMARFVAGEIDVTEMLPTIERAVYRLTANNQPLAKQARPGKPRKNSSP